MTTHFPSSSSLSYVSNLASPSTGEKHNALLPQNGQNNADATSMAVSSGANVSEELESSFPTSVSKMVRQHRLILPKPRDCWRLLEDPICGEINGLPTMRGFAIATNGIFVAIKLLSGKIEFGHLSFFVIDKEEEEKVMNKAASEFKVKREPKQAKCWEGF